MKPIMQSFDPFASSSAARWMLGGIIGFCCLIELTLSAADMGFIVSTRLRQTVYEYGGFWPGLLRNWSPNYTGQPYTMFLTYGFLHGGMMHLAMNMVTLWSLGKVVIARVKVKGFLWLYTLSILGGGLGFGMLAPDLRPMVGASGALFGLAGGLFAWLYVDRFTFQERLWPVLQGVLALVILNIVLYWAMDGQLAWQTHGGGFVTGWIAALLIDPRPREIDSAPSPGGDTDQTP